MRANPYRWKSSKLRPAGSSTLGLSTYLLLPTFKTRMGSPHERCLSQNIVGEVEPRLSQGKFHLILAWRLAIQVGKAPKNCAAAIHMYSRCHLLDHQFRAQPPYQMLDAMELKYITH